MPEEPMVIVDDSVEMVYDQPQEYLPPIAQKRLLLVESPKRVCVQDYSMGKVRLVKPASLGAMTSGQTFDIPKSDRSVKTAPRCRHVLPPEDAELWKAQVYCLVYEQKFLAAKQKKTSEKEREMWPIHIKNEIKYRDLHRQAKAYLLAVVRPYAEKMRMDAMVGDEVKIIARVNARKLAEEIAMQEYERDKARMKKHLGKKASAEAS